MGFLNVSFDTNHSLLELVERLGKLSGIEVVGDWHEHRMRAVVDSGLPLTSAPAQSVARDRLKGGPALHVQMMLTNGGKLSGQIRRENLLVSGRNVADYEIESDYKVRTLLDALRQVANEVEVEIG